MPNGSALKLLLVLNVAWGLRGPAHEKKVHTKKLIPVSDRRSRIEYAATYVSLKFRNRFGAITLDNEARLAISDSPKEVFLRSDQLAVDMENRDAAGAILVIHL